MLSYKNVYLLGDLFKRNNNLFWKLVPDVIEQLNPFLLFE